MQVLMAPGLEPSAMVRQGLVNSSSTSAASDSSAQALPEMKRQTCCAFTAPEQSKVTHGL